MKGFLPKLLIVGLLFFGGQHFGAVIKSGSAKMQRVRDQITPGMAVTELENALGEPRQVVRGGDHLSFANRSFQLPKLDQDSVIHVYCKEGIPYFNVYVIIDEPAAKVRQVEIENLWW